MSLEQSTKCIVHNFYKCRGLWSKRQSIFVALQTRKSLSCATRSIVHQPKIPPPEKKRVPPRVYLSWKRLDELQHQWLQRPLKNWFAKGRVQKKIRKKYGLLPNPPRTHPPLPGVVIFPDKKIDPHFFLEMTPLLVKQILHLVPSQNLLFFAFMMASIIAINLPRQANFKAILIAVDMS